MHTNQVVCLRYHPISGLVWTNKCLDIMILLVVWFRGKQIAGSDLLKDEFFKDFLGYVPMGGQLLLFFSVASEVVLIYSIKYEPSCFSKHQKAV